MQASISLCITAGMMIYSICTRHLCTTNVLIPSTHPSTISHRTIMTITRSVDQGMEQRKSVRREMSPAERRKWIVSSTKISLRERRRSSIARRTAAISSKIVPVAELKSARKLHLSVTRGT